MNDQDTGRGFLTGLIIGAVTGAIAGAAVALLYAPKSGAETRSLVKEKAGQAAEKVKEAVAKTKEAAINAEKKIEEKFRPKTTEE